jgi:hypothetical protein
MWQQRYSIPSDTMLKEIALPSNTNGQFVPEW